VRFIVTNRLPEPTCVRWHGLIIRNVLTFPRP
jgi:FtsP/CotA-like multicopper oxidase with cupredoxin domain